MPSLRVDKKILDFIKSKNESSNVSCFISDALNLFIKRKIDCKCFSCQEYKDQISKLEIGRQILALKEINSNTVMTKNSHGWVFISDNQIMEYISKYSSFYKRSVKVVCEQAILEHITRPKKCIECNYYMIFFNK